MNRSKRKLVLPAVEVKLAATLNWAIMTRIVDDQRQFYWCLYIGKKIVGGFYVKMPYKKQSISLELPYFMEYVGGRVIFTISQVKGIAYYDSQIFYSRFLGSQ